MFKFSDIQDQAAMLARRAAAPLRPAKPQVQADHGLFSDDSRQVDLVDELRRIGRIGPPLLQGSALENFIVDHCETNGIRYDAGVFATVFRPLPDMTGIEAVALIDAAAKVYGLRVAL